MLWRSSSRSEVAAETSPSKMNTPCSPPCAPPLRLQMQDKEGAGGLKRGLGREDVPFFSFFFGAWPPPRADKTLTQDEEQQQLARRPAGWASCLHADRRGKLGPGRSKVRKPVPARVKASQIVQWSPRTASGKKPWLGAGARGKGSQGRARAENEETDLQQQPTFVCRQRTHR